MSAPEGRLTGCSDAIRAAKFTLAVADNDGQAMLDLLGELSSPAEVLGFTSELAAIGIGLAQRHSGPAWRSVIGNAIVELEMADERAAGGRAE